MTMDTIRVDANRCVGHGKCYLIAPRLMRPADDEGRAEFVESKIDPLDREVARLVDHIVQACPEGALSRHEIDGDRTDG